MSYNFLFILLFLMILTTNVLAEQPRVCFYNDENYQGRSICATQGQAVSNLKA